MFYLSEQTKNELQLAAPLTYELFVEIGNDL